MERPMRKVMLTEAGGEVKGLSASRKSTRLFIFLISFGSTDIRLPLISSFTSLRYVSSAQTRSFLRSPVASPLSLEGRDEEKEKRRRKGKEKGVE